MRTKSIAVLLISILWMATTSVIAAYESSSTGYDFSQADAKLSADGKYLAMALVKEGRRSLVVVETDGFKPVGGANFGTWQDVGNFHWANNERLVMEVLHREEWDNNPKFYGELYSVDFDGRHGNMIFGFRAGEDQVGSKRQKNKPIYGWAQIISLMPEDPDHILISSSAMPGGSELFRDRQKRNQVRDTKIETLHSTVHRLNVQTARMSTSYTRSPEANAAFVASSAGDLQYAYGGSPVKLYRYLDNDWVLQSLDTGEGFQPITFSADRQTMVALDNDESGSVCLYSFDLQAMTKTKRHSECGLTAKQLALTIAKTDVYAIRSGNSKPLYEVFDRSTVEGDFFAQIIDMFEGQKVDVTSKSADGNYWVVRTQGIDDMFGFYLYNKSKNEFVKVI